MATLLNPYLSFSREAREALNFYHGVLGGDLTTTTFGQSGMTDDPAHADLVMHGQLTTAAGHTLMASDTPPGMEQRGGTQQVSLSGDDEATLTRWWEGLAEGATIVEPLVPSPWGDLFGMLVDRFGILWMVNIAAPSSHDPASGADLPDAGAATDGGHQDTAEQWYEGGGRPAAPGHEDTAEQWSAGEEPPRG
ncbi:VOC family protein [Agrococcus sp. SL85]|uniref:VOC family protein n=1 Tax=Agrococcus sp. SL85 TaxID=2995141 RepID=UPI002D1E45E9|nr:VOC family protein [Agrococcus sp. SL85]